MSTHIASGPITAPQRTPVLATAAIIAVWAAVLAVAAFGGDIVTTGGSAGSGGTVRVPSEIPVALFACIATFFIARYGYRRDQSTR